MGKMTEGFGVVGSKGEGAGMLAVTLSNLGPIWTLTPYAGDIMAKTRGVNVGKNYASGPLLQKRR